MPLQEPVFTVYSAMERLLLEVVAYIPKIVIAIIIWYLGKFFINTAIKLLGKIDLKAANLDNRAIIAFSKILSILGRVLLVLIIMDYLGIGESVIGALTQGVVFAIAIALGISFGEALKPDAKSLTETARRWFHGK